MCKNQKEIVLRRDEHLINLAVVITSSRVVNKEGLSKSKELGLWFGERSGALY